MPRSLQSARTCAAVLLASSNDDDLDGRPGCGGVIEGEIAAGSRFSALRARTAARAVVKRADLLEGKKTDLSPKVVTGGKVSVQVVLKAAPC